MTRALLILSVLASLSRAEIIDRIAVTLDNQVITESEILDRKSTRLNSSHLVISYAVFCLKKKKKETTIIQVGSRQLARRHPQDSGHQNSCLVKLTSGQMGNPL